MSAISGFVEVFGFHTNRSLGDDEDGAQAVNILNISGYLPGVGIVTAIARWVAAAEDNDIGFRVGQIVRGIFEFIGLGILIGLLVDLPVSIHRHCCVRSDVPRWYVPEHDQDALQ